MILFDNKKPFFVRLMPFSVTVRKPDFSKFFALSEISVGMLYPKRSEKPFSVRPSLSLKASITYSSSSPPLPSGPGA